jgi:methionine synthase II (cobalamin-independent)
MLSRVRDGSSGGAFPWAAGSASGVGSMPGTDMAEAMAIILGELPDLPHLAELPARGPGADMIGRTAGALLVDLPVQTTARGWRLADRPGRDQRRAADFMAADLDVLADACAGYRGPLKIQVCGPWTLAASLELNKSVQPALADAGAVSDLVASLAEGVAEHVTAVAARVPDATVMLQVDEPALAAVLDGALPTASGLRRLPAVDEPRAADSLRAVLSRAPVATVVHSCATGMPFRTVLTAGADTVSFDLGLLRREDEDALGEVVEAGLGIFAGAARTDSVARETAGAIIDVWRRIGLADARLSEQVVVTPPCGLAGALPEDARGTLGQCREAAKLIPELIEEHVR